MLNVDVGDVLTIKGARASAAIVMSQFTDLSPSEALDTGGVLGPRWNKQKNTSSAFSHSNLRMINFFLTHWGRNKIVAISQTTFSKAFAEMTY